MTCRVEFSRHSEKSFKGIRDKKLRERIAAALEYIAKDPAIGKPLQAQLKGDRSFRAGDYRIVYHFYKERGLVGVLRIEHRKDVYR